MNASYLRSDQLLAWSVRFGKQVHCRFTRAPREAHQAAATLAQHSARFTNRALQTLWQSRLSLCPGSWSRPKALPLRELPRTATAHGLHTAGAARTDEQLAVGLSARARDLGTDLRDQSGTLASSRDTLSERGERDRTAHHFTRCPRCDMRSACIDRRAELSGHPLRQHADRQHVGRMDRCTGLVLHRRGGRS